MQDKKEKIAQYLGLIFTIILFLSGNIYSQKETQMIDQTYTTTLFPGDKILLTNNKTADSVFVEVSNSTGIVFSKKIQNKKDAYLIIQDEWLEPRDTIFNKITLLKIRSTTNIDSVIITAKVRRKTQKLVSREWKKSDIQKLKDKKEYSLIEKKDVFEVSRAKNRMALGIKINQDFIINHKMSTLWVTTKETRFFETIYLDRELTDFELSINHILKGKDGIIILIVKGLRKDVAPGVIKEDTSTIIVKASGNSIEKYIE